MSSRSVGSYSRGLSMLNFKDLNEITAMKKLGPAEHMTSACVRSRVHKAVSLLKRLVVAFAPGKPGFNPTVNYRGFVMCRVSQR